MICCYSHKIQCRMIESCEIVDFPHEQLMPTGSFPVAFSKRMIKVTSCLRSNGPHKKRHGFHVFSAYKDRIINISIYYYAISISLWRRRGNGYDARFISSQVGVLMPFCFNREEKCELHFFVFSCLKKKIDSLVLIMKTVLSTLVTLLEGKQTLSPYFSNVNVK